MNPPWSNQYVGIPFEPLGRGKRGLDCWGLVLRVYKEQLGIDVEDYHNYFDHVDYDAIENSVKFEKSKWIESKEPQEFDVILLKIYGRPVHVGIIVDRQWFIHASDDGQVKLERYKSPKWKNRLGGFFRHAAVPSLR